MILLLMWVLNCIEMLWFHAKPNLRFKRLDFETFTNKNCRHGKVEKNVYIYLKLIIVRIKNIFMVYVNIKSYFIVLQAESCYLTEETSTSESILGFFMTVTLVIVHLSSMRWIRIFCNIWESIKVTQLITPVFLPYLH